MSKTEETDSVDGQNLVYWKRCKSILVGDDLKCQSGVQEALEEELVRILKKAAQRCRDNGKKLVRPQDI